MADKRIYLRRERDSWAGVALSAAAGLGAGLLAGLLVSEVFGNVDSERLRRAVARLRARPAADADDPAAVEAAVQEALRANPSTRRLSVAARALGDGIVELTGAAPDATARRLAGDVARGVAGADIVVNRILVEGSDIPRREPTPKNAG